MNTHGTMAATLAVLTALGVGSLQDARSAEDNSTNIERLLQDIKDELSAQRQARQLDNQYNRAEFRRLEDRLDQLERRLSGMSSVSTSKSYTYDPAPRRGILRLDNRLGVWATVRVDGIDYSVAPLSVREIRDQPLGSFSYEVTAEGYSWGSRRQTTLDTRPWTLTIY